MPTPRPAKLIPRLTCTALRIALIAAALAGFRADSLAQRVTLATRTPSAAAIDAGELPSSTPIEITLTLATSPAQTATLDDFLVNATQASSPGYHQWLTPQQFAARFGATDDEIATVSAWLTLQGLSIDAVSPAHTRLTISGPASVIESALAITLHQYRIGDTTYFANPTAASLPPEIAPLIASISGLDNMPPTTVVTATTSTGATIKLTPATQTTDPLSTIASAIDANATPTLILNTAACSTDFAQSDYDAYRTLFRQANAQGITILATSACTADNTSSFPASLTEVTALATPTAAANSTGIAARPPWQSAPGLPAGTTRVEPDLTATSTTAFAQTLATIIQQSGTRLGNINATLYALAPEPGLYTQPNAAAPGTWEPATGLGQVDLAKLAQAFPRGITASMTSVNSSIYGATYGQPFTLAATVQPSSGGSNAPIPTGTVTFSAAAQGTLGTATLTNGNATLPLSGTLPVGTYTTSATYSGDSLYAPSASPPSAVVTISQATGTITAGITPSTIGGSATAALTVTVTLPFPGEPPTGNVTATVNGVPGAVYTGALTPVANTATATSAITIPAPINPGTYTVQITCAGSANFQCPTPGLVSLTSTGSNGGSPTGNTSTTLIASSTNPTAGQAITLTATLATTVAGTPTGTITFYDNGTSIATAPISNKQASAIVTLDAGATQMLTATYSGDTTFNTSTSAAVVVNVPAVSSSMALTASSTNALRGANIFFTAQVSAGVPPTGTVTFFDTYNGNTAQIGTAILAPTGAATSAAQISTSGLLDGTHSIYAAYLGDANSGASSSTLAVAISDYTVTATPQTLTLTSGQTGTVTLAVGVIGTFTGKVSFTCLAPANTQTTCSITPTSRTGAGNVTMTIATTATQARTMPPRPRRLTQAAALAMLLCLCAPHRRRRLPTILLAMLALGGVTSFAVGCSTGTSSTPAAETGSPTGTTQLSIDTAGTDGVTTVTQDFQYQVTLN